MAKVWDLAAIRSAEIYSCPADLVAAALALLGSTGADIEHFAPEVGWACPAEEATRAGFVLLDAVPNAWALRRPGRTIASLEQPADPGWEVVPLVEDPLAGRLADLGQFLVSCGGFTLCDA